MSKQLEAVVSIAGSISPSLEKSIKGATDKLGGLNVKAIAVGAAVGASVVAIGKAVFEAGEYLADLGGRFDEVEDTIRIGTGATGDALDGLLDSFDNVYSSVPTSMEDASKAIADYNTRLGLTGKGLEDISVQAIQVADMLGEDLGGVIESSSKAFQNWDIEAENMGESMDYIFKVSQSTGVGFSDLMGQLQSSGAILQECGYSFEDAATLLGQVEKAGYDSSTVMTALNKAAKKAAADGFTNINEGIDSYIDAILNAESSTEAYNIACEVFGTKGAATMVEAVESGALSLKDLEAELKASSETIGGAAEDTYDFAEMLQLLKQKGEVALKPLANAVFKMINDLMPVLSKAMDGLIPIIERMTEKLVPIVEKIVPSIMPLIEELLPEILDMAAAIGEELIPPIVEIMTDILPVLVQVIQMLTPILKTIIKNIMPVIVKLVKQLLPILLKIISAVLPVITKLLETLLPIVGQIIDAVLPVVIRLLEMLMPIINQIIDKILPIVIQLLETFMPIIQQLCDSILPVIVKLLEALMPILTPIIDVLSWLIENVLSVLTPILEWIAELAGEVLVAAIQILTSVIEGITEAVKKVIEWFKQFGQKAAEIFTNAWETIKSVWSSVSNWFKTNVTEPVGNFFSNAWNNIESAASTAWTGVKSAWTSAGSWFSTNITGPISTKFSSLWDGVKNNASTAWNAIKSSASTVFSNVYNTISEKMNNAKNTISNIINSIKGFFNFQFKWPSIPMPHFSISPSGWKIGDLLKGSIPRLSISWYAEGGILDNPMLFGMLGGNLLGGGEAGQEAVLPLDTLWDKMATVFRAVLAEQSGESYTAQAGKLVELDNFSLNELSQSTNGPTVIYDFSGFTWSPTVEGSGGSNDDLMAMLREHEAEFFDWLEEFIRMREVSSFA